MELVRVSNLSNFSRCIFCGLCEEACPTTAIQLTPDFEMGEYKRQDLVYEKEDLLISGPGKYPEYNFYRMAGMAIDGKDKGEAETMPLWKNIRSSLSIWWLLTCIRSPRPWPVKVARWKMRLRTSIALRRSMTARFQVVSARLCDFPDLSSD